MSIVTRDALKKYFKKGCYPTEDQFAALIDSVIHKDDSDIRISQISGLTDLLNNKADLSAIEFDIKQLIKKVPSQFATGEELSTVEIVDITSSNKLKNSNVLSASVGVKVANLWKKAYPTTMSITDNGSTTSLDKIKTIVIDTGDNSHPKMSLSGKFVYTPYSGTVISENINNSDIILDGEYGTYQHAAADGKTVYSIIDANSVTSGSKIYYHVKTCYIWFDISNSMLEIPNSATSLSPTKCVGNSFSDTNCVRKVMSTNFLEDNYIYIAVPVGWNITKVTAHSNIADSVFIMSQVNANNENYNIYISTTGVLTANGNTFFASEGTGSIA